MVELREPPRAPDRRTTDTTMRGLLVLVLILLTGLVSWILFRSGSTGVDPARAGRYREVAARLQAAGALDQAAALYEGYLHESDASADQRARIAYSLGTNYLQSGQYDRALRWFYEAEALGPGDLKEELSSRIVHCLERLGRHHAAQAALESRVQLQAENVERSPEDPIVARVGQTEVRRSEVLRSLDSVPPEIAASFQTPAGRKDLLRKYVADELLWRKAVKLEYDRDPEVERRLAEVLKQLAVTRFVELEIVEKIEVDEADLRNYFEANRDRYANSEQEETPGVTFEQVRQVVELDYQRVKMQSAYTELIESELSTQDVEWFPEGMVDDP